MRSLAPPPPHWCMILPLAFGLLLIVTFVTYHIEIFVIRMGLEAALADFDARPRCNGHWALCARPLNRVVIPTTHNSFSVGSHILANQYRSVGEQLRDGVRGFMVDPHWRDPATKDTVDLCHKKCLEMDGGSLTGFLTTLATFLRENPREVIVVLMESYVTPTAIAASVTASGAQFLAYAQPRDSAVWPALATLISTNKRLILFVDTDVDYGKWPWLMRQWDFVFENPYSYYSAANFTELDYACSVDRPKHTLRPLSVLNHFVYQRTSVDGTPDDYPYPALAPQVNTYNSLIVHARGCANWTNSPQGGDARGAYFPNFLAVDFYDVAGEPEDNDPGFFAAVRDLNLSLQ